MKFLNSQKGIAPIIAVIVLAVILVGGGAYFFKQQNQTKSLTIVMNTINLSSINSSDPLDYFGVQIIAPSTYFVTSDTMLESYDSQGGMAPPRLILMKNHQIFGNNYNEITTSSLNDCIVIWSTMSFNSIDEWNGNVTNFKGELKNQETLEVGSRNASLYLRSMASGNIYTAFLAIGDKNKTSYYFHTCNTNNKKDFVSVIKSMKFRRDNKF